MIHQAVFQIEMNNAGLIYQAVTPDQEEGCHERSEGHCRLSADTVLEVTIQASDLSALRASLNTWLRQIQVASEMIDRSQI
jgi:KEOPS complex subunit Pcc1